MHLTTILTVFASTVVATKNLVKVDNPSVGSDSVPNDDLKKRIITDPAPFQFDYASKTTDQMRSFIQDQCQQKAECTTATFWGKSDKKDDKQPKFWNGSMYSGKSTTKNDYIQDPTGTVWYAEAFTVPDSKKHRAHKAH